MAPWGFAFRHTVLAEALFPPRPTQTKAANAAIEYLSVMRMTSPMNRCAAFELALVSEPPSVMVSTYCRKERRAQQEHGARLCPSHNSSGSKYYCGYIACTDRQRMAEKNRSLAPSSKIGGADLQ